MQSKFNKIYAIENRNLLNYILEKFGWMYHTGQSTIISICWCIRKRIQTEKHLYIGNLYIFKIWTAKYTLRLFENFLIIIWIDKSVRVSSLSWLPQLLITIALPLNFFKNNGQLVDWQTDEFYFQTCERRRAGERWIYFR